MEGPQALARKVAGPSQQGRHYSLQDLTRARVDELASIRFADLPLKMAIKTVKGDGKRVMAVFEDPNCPYCRKLHETMRGIDNVTVYTFLLNILSEDSAAMGSGFDVAALEARLGG